MVIKLTLELIDFRHVALKTAMEMAISYMLHSQLYVYQKLDSKKKNTVEKNPSQNSFRINVSIVVLKVKFLINCVYNSITHIPG